MCFCFFLLIAHHSSLTTASFTFDIDSFAGGIRQKNSPEQWIKKEQIPKYDQDKVNNPQSLEDSNMAQKIMDIADQTSGSCQLCTSGYEYNTFTGMCDGTPICNKGVYDPQINICAAPPICDPPGSYNPATKKCETGATTSQNCYQVNNCYTAYNCYSVRFWHDNDCNVDIDVPKDWNNGENNVGHATECGQNTCADYPFIVSGGCGGYKYCAHARCNGYYDTRTQCDPYTQCNPYTQCDTITTCPSAYTLNGSICNAPPKCDSGLTFNSGFDRCVMNPTCLGKLDPVTDKCVTQINSCKETTADSILAMVGTKYCEYTNTCTEWLDVQKNGGKVSCRVYVDVHRPNCSDGVARTECIADECGDLFNRCVIKDYMAYSDIPDGANQSTGGVKLGIYFFECPPEVYQVCKTYQGKLTCPDGTTQVCNSVRTCKKEGSTSSLGYRSNTCTATRKSSASSYLKYSAQAEELHNNPYCLKKGEIHKELKNQKLTITGGWESNKDENYFAPRDTLKANGWCKDYENPNCINGVVKDCYYSVGSGYYFNFSPNEISWDTCWSKLSMANNIINYINNQYLGAKSPYIVKRINSFTNSDNKYAVTLSGEAQFDNWGFTAFGSKICGSYYEPCVQIAGAIVYGGSSGDYYNRITYPLNLVAFGATMAGSINVPEGATLRGEGNQLICGRVQKCGSITFTPSRQAVDMYLDVDIDAIYEQFTCYEDSYYGC